MENQTSKAREDLINSIIEYDRSVMEQYLTKGDVNRQDLASLVRLATISGGIYPVLCGSAFKNKAIQPLLDAIVSYLPSPNDIPPVLSCDGLVMRFASCDETFTALVFKISNDNYVSNLSYIRVYAGVIDKGSVIFNSRTKLTDRIMRIFKMHANVRSEVNCIFAGDIAAIVGLRNAVTGDTLCDLKQPINLLKMQFPTPVIQIALEPQTKSDQEKLSSILTKLVSEDPTLSVRMDSETGQIILAGMGELHLEIVIDRINRDYSLTIITSLPQVSYRETIAKDITEEYTHKKQTGGSGQYAKVKILFEQNDDNKIMFESKLIGGAIPKEFIPGVKKGLDEAFARGPASGFPVIKIKATLIDGDYHEVDSSIMSFEIAAKLCYKQAVTNGGAIILEPIMRLEVIAPNDCVGTIICDLVSRRSQILNQTATLNYSVIVCYTPLAMLFKYIDGLRSLSKGRATYSMTFERYSRLPNA